MPSEWRGDRTKPAAAKRTGPYKNPRARVDLHISIRVKIAAARVAVSQRRSFSDLAEEALRAMPEVQEELRALEGQVFEDEEEGEKENAEEGLTDG